MPYINRDARAHFEPALKLLCDEVSGTIGADDGELNYLLTRILLAWIGDKPRYQTYARAVAALECCKLELYRKQIAPYEDVAMVKNGPVNA